MKIKEAFWVDEVDNGLEDFVLDEEMNSEDESWVNDDEELLMESNVVDELFIEEDEPEDEANCIMVPGSDVQYVEDEGQEEDRPKSWENDKDHAQFVGYIEQKLSKIPKHSGNTIYGCERAKSFLKTIQNEISQAMKTDLDGVIDESKIDVINKKIVDMIDVLDKRIKKLQGTNKTANLKVNLVSSDKCEKCGSNAPMWHDVDNDRLVCMSCEAEVSADGLVKNAGTPVLNVYMSAFERAVVGTLINSTVSAGRNIEESYHKLKDKYAFTPREELAIQQLLSDHGYPMRWDRGLVGEEEDRAKGNSVDWQTNYPA